MRTSVIIAVAVYAVATCLVIVATNARSIRGGRVGGFSFGGSIGTITYGTRYHYNDGYPPKFNCGDVYNNTWADNDLIYVVNDDAGAWRIGSVDPNNCAPPTPGYPVNFGSVDGFTSALTGTQINTMSPWNDDGGTSFGYATKSSGLISISGVLYMALSKQYYGSSGAGASGVANVQTAFDGQIIKSSDHGVTWTPANTIGSWFPSPMFPGGPNSIPGFFQYGKDYVGQTVDRSNQYVYAVSAIGFQNGLTAGYGCWNNCDQLRLGRVLITDMPDTTTGSHWGYYQGGDGSIDGNWGAWSTAAPLLNVVCGIAGLSQPLYIAGLAGGSYVYINTYFIPATSQSDGCAPHSGTAWDFYVAPHPWGPWVLKDHTVFGYYYTPNLVSKSVSIAGDGTVTLTVFATDDQYNLTIQPVTITQVP